MTLRLGVAVLHYKYWPEIEECLKRLVSQSYRPERVVLVDNASDDGSVEKIAQAFPEIHILGLSDNLGYAAAMNAALRLLDRDHDVDAALLITHDCWLDGHALEHLADRMQDRNGVGAVGPLFGLRAEPKSVYGVGGTILDRTWDTELVRDPMRPEIADWAGQPPREVTWLDGACVLLRMQAWRHVGPLDERYFLYYEDVDYGLRLRAAGWTIECVPSAHAWHQTGRPRALLDYLVSRNHLMLIFTHAPRRIRARQVVREILWILRDTASRRPERVRRARSHLSGLVDFVRRRVGPPPPRRALE